jgi:uncharacterized membrane protein YsdA (DUF1294 family)
MELIIAVFLGGAVGFLFGSKSMKKKIERELIEVLNEYNEKMK